MIMLSRKMINNIYYVYILAAGVLWGMIALFFNGLSELGLSRFQIMLMRVGIAAICLGIYIAITNRQLFKIDLRDWWMFFGTGICSLMFFNYCYFTCIAMVSVSVAAVLLYTAPMMVMVMSIILFKEKFTAKKGIVVFMTFAGCVLVSGVGGDTAFSWKGILLGLGSGFFYALYSIFGRYAINRGYGAWTMTFYTFLFCSIGCAFLSDWQVITSTMVHVSGTVYWVLGLGFVTAFLPYVLYSMGLEQMESSKASILASVEPVVSALFGVFVFHEALSIWGILGIAMVLGAIVVLNVKRI
jgi:drug/metabolite transporter (DMT)-like permease